jgi:hypothetical protein
MDLSNPAALLSGLALSSAGAGCFIYGKKQQSPVALLGGLVLCVVPMVVASVLAMWLIGGACVGGMWWMSKNG